MLNLEQYKNRFEKDCKKFDGEHAIGEQCFWSCNSLQFSKLISNCRFTEVAEKAASKTGNFALLFVNKLFSQNVNQNSEINIFCIKISLSASNKKSLFFY